jgi:hypothetical protein
MQNTIYPCKHLFTASYLAVFFAAISAFVTAIFFYSALCALIAHLEE